MFRGESIGRRKHKAALLPIALLLMWGVAGMSVGDQYFTNGYMTVKLFDKLSTMGIFTVMTGLDHPIPESEVLCNTNTSYFTFLDYSAEPEELFNTWAVGDEEEYEDGRLLMSMIELPENPATLITFGTTGFRTIYSLQNFEVTQDVLIKGDGLDDTFVQQTVAIKNTTTAVRYIGLRYLWDYMISESDDALFRTRLPDSDWTAAFTDFIEPCFAWYEMTDDNLNPSFTVFGTALGGNLEIPPVPPDEIRYASFASANSRVWSFSNTGGEIDSCVVYYWGKHAPVPVSPGESIAFTQYITTAPQLLNTPMPLRLSIDAPDWVRTEEQFQYVISVKNSGNTSVHSIVIVDTVPAELEVLSVTGSPQVHGNMLVWQMGELGPGQDSELIITVGTSEEFKEKTVTNIVSASFWHRQYCNELFPITFASANVSIRPRDMNLRIFPNPFNRGLAARGTVKFEGVVPGTQVRIYTVRGLQVWKGVVQTPYIIEWDGKNDAGKPVAPGTYLWIVESEDKKERGTLIIE